MKKWTPWILLLALALLTSCNWSRYAPVAIGVTETPAPPPTWTPAPSSTPRAEGTSVSVASNKRAEAVVCTGYATGALNVRACPGVQCWAFFVLAEGRKVVVDGQTSQAEDGATWAHITQPVDGWVNARYLCKEQQR